MNWSKEFAPLQFANNYEEKCFNHFIRIRQHEDCRLRFAICSTDSIIVAMMNYLMLTKTLTYLDNF